MKQYEGIIEISKIENTGDNADQIGTLKARFVRYPNCQQLSVWLPEYGGNGYGKLYIIKNANQQVIDEQTVSSKINGSVLMTWDTLSWSPSDYRLEIEHPKGGKHCLYFKKLKEGAYVPKDKIVEMPTASAENPSLANILLPKEEPEPVEEDSMWKVYTDGFGNPIPNEDHAIREKTMESIHEIFSTMKDAASPHLEYEGNVRGGNVIYIDGEIRLSFWHEMGGGDCQMYIDIPSEAHWESATKTPLSKRREILLFIASTVKREQAPSWRFEIRDTGIAFY